MAPATVIAKGENKSFAIPVKNRVGINTTIITKVDANTGVATSKAASRAALVALYPFVNAVIFSKTTIELSTKRPNTNAIPPK